MLSGEYSLLVLLLLLLLLLLRHCTSTDVVYKVLVGALLAFVNFFFLLCFGGLDGVLRYGFGVVVDWSLGWLGFGLGVWWAWSLVGLEFGWLEFEVVGVWSHGSWAAPLVSGFGEFSSSCRCFCADFSLSLGCLEFGVLGVWGAWSLGCLKVGIHGARYA